MTYCDFKPGDEMVAVDEGGDCADSPPPKLVVGAVYVCCEVTEPFSCEDCGRCAGVAVEGVHHPSGWFYAACSFRKVQRRKTDLSIEAFLTIKPGFEEPKRAPAPKRERVS